MTNKHLRKWTKTSWKLECGANPELVQKQGGDYYDFVTADETKLKEYCRKCLAAKNIKVPEKVVGTAVVRSNASISNFGVTGDMTRSQILTMDMIMSDFKALMKHVFPGWSSITIEIKEEL